GGALCACLYERRAPAPLHAGLDRRGPGRGLGDPAVRDGSGLKPPGAVREPIPCPSPFGEGWTRLEVAAVLPPKALSGKQMHVDVGIMAIGLGGPPHRDEDARRVAAVLEDMAVAAALGKGRDVAGAQDGLAAILDQH
ncbi:hypothetical protein QP64_00040, partial [Staphylococcus aureus]